MKNILLFLCSGTSSRFNGKTKALAKISGSETVIEFNLKKVSEFDQVYIVANETNYSEFEKLNLENVKLIKIKTGNGDADSLLNALKELQKVQKLEDFENTSLTFCWGDTLFLSDTIFKKLSALTEENSEDLSVPCSLDKNPYAYFDFITDSGNIDGSKILKSHFKTEKSVEIGLHDQSIFKVNLKTLFNLLNRFKEYHFKNSNSELKFLKFIDFLNTENCLDVKCILIDSGNSVSFNTQLELDNIIKNFLSDF